MSNAVTNFVSPDVTEGGVVTEGQFCDWIATAVAGEQFQYHRGYLICDRAGSNGAYDSTDRHRINAVARRAWIGAELGLLHLYSVRLGEGNYRYVAVRSDTSLRFSRMN